MADTVTILAQCPVCVGEAACLVHIHSPDDPQARREIYQCPDCGYLFAQPAIEMNFRDLPEQQFYDNWEALDVSGNIFVVNAVTAASRRAGLSAERKAGERLRILEAGCGAGQVLCDFRAHGWEIRGVEPWRAVATAGSKYLRVPIETVRMEDAAVEPDTQDVVLSIDVLSHVAAPDRYLDACRRALRPGGLLYLVVPNAACAERERAGWDWGFFVPTRQMGAYTQGALTRLLSRCGFIVDEVATYNGARNDMLMHVVARRLPETTLTWDDIASPVSDEEVPVLERSTIDPATLTPEQRAWQRDGVLLLEKFLPDELIDRYCAVREQLAFPAGWKSKTPYLNVPELKDICLYGPLADKLEHLIGEKMGLHLNLTGWVSTERDWHQDHYLNPAFVSSYYVAVWMALDDIQTDAGPFEYVRGSHRWPLIRQSNVLKLLDHDGSDPAWPIWSERILTPFFEHEIVRRNAQVERFLGKRGDMLIWHARLLHRGSLPTRPGAERRALISHYSAINRRPDMGRVARHGNGGYYFVFNTPTVSRLRLRLARVFG
jgi:SAM-dependent methyltransferase